MSQMAGPDPIWTNCPNCNTEILTTTQKSISTFQMLVAGGLCCFGFPLCFYIPFCIDDWKDVLHTCPNCNYGIGKFKKLWWNQKRNHQKKLPYIIIYQLFFIMKIPTLNKVQHIDRSTVRTFPLHYYSSLSSNVVRGW